MSWDPKTALIRWRPRVFLDSSVALAERRDRKELSYDDVKISTFLLPITPPDPPIPAELIPPFKLNSRLFLLLTKGEFTIPTYPHVQDLSLMSEQLRDPAALENEDHEPGRQAEREASLESIDETPINPFPESDKNNTPQPKILKTPFLKRKPSSDLTPGGNSSPGRASPKAKKRKTTSAIVLESPLTTNVPAGGSNPFIASVDPPRSSPSPRSTEEDHARSEQWRVGKRPGHQGSHARVDDKGEERTVEKRGEKRSLGQSITESAEKVLKKPFRPPKVVLTKTQARCKSLFTSSARTHRSSSPASDVIPTTPSSNVTTPLGYTPHVYLNGHSKFTPTRHPMFTENKICTPKLSQPFKTPTRQQIPSRPSNADIDKPVASMTSKSTHGVTLSRNSQPAPPRGTNLITTLENKARQLREALGIIKNAQKEEELEQLSQQWLTAGRDIVERLFSTIPPPTSTEGSMAGIPNRSIPRVRPFHETFGGMQGLSQEEQEWFEKVNRDEDGNPIDEEGNLLMREVGGEDELRKMLEEQIRLGEQREARDGKKESDQWYSSDTYDAGNMSGLGDSNIPVQSDPSSWTYGALMLRLSVDPGLLGWNEENEDWD